MKKIILIFAVCIVLTACVSTTKNISADYALENNDSNGLLLGSLTKSGHGFWAPQYYFQKLDKSHKGSFKFKKQVFLDRIATEIPGVKGKVIAVDLPAGEYKISGWYINQTVASLSSLDGFDVRFTVLPGKVTYMGDLNMHVERGGLFKVGVGGIDIQIKDNKLRDLKQIQILYPNIDTSNVETNLLKILSLK